MKYFNSSFLEVNGFHLTEKEHRRALNGSKVKLDGVKGGKGLMELKSGDLLLNGTAINFIDNKVGCGLVSVINMPCEKKEERKKTKKNKV